MPAANRYNWLFPSFRSGNGFNEAQERSEQNKVFSVHNNHNITDVAEYYKEDI